MCTGKLYSPLKEYRMVVGNVYRKTVQSLEGVKNAGRQCVQENFTVP